jgi:predicted transcriptional regulator
VKPWSIIRPDYYAYETDAWIIFPWDRAETLEELVVKKGLSLEEAARASGDDVEFVRRVLRTRARGPTAAND